SQDRLSRRAIQLISDNRIQQAIEEGQFDNLPGTGKPIPDIDEPYDPMWWVKQWVRREKLGREIAAFYRKRQGLVLLILCLLPAAVSAASATDIPLNTSGYSHFSPGQGVALLPGGGYAAVWSWTILGGPYSDSDVRMQWVRPDGSRVFPKGNREVAGSGLAEEGGPVIAPHPRSGVFVAFSAGDDEVKTEVLVDRYDGAGKRLWRVAAAVEEGRRNQVQPSLVPDADGGVYVCFLSLPADGFPTSSKILCQHLDANGRRRWPRQGLAVSSLPGLRGGPRGLTDGQGGLLVVWRSERPYGADPQRRGLIEGQRFAPNGTRRWSPQGRLLQEIHAPAQGDIFYRSDLRAVSDGEGGAVVAFDDRFSEGEPAFDVAAQRVDRSGNPLWGLGAVVTEEAGTQTVVDLVPGPGGGAFILVRDDQGRAELGIHRLDGTGGIIWQTRLSAPETHDTYGFGAFDGDVLRVVWTRYHQASDQSQVRLVVLDLNGNRLDGPDGELLAEGSAVLGFVYDPAHDQGFAVLSSATDPGKVTGALIDGQP
ncbi:MAG TPA: DUF1992 domain-containing protein, partial [Arthrobacter sp.]|nr:DUF1992 domain-containing protein [Arthrobacter sp.]